MLRSLVTGDCRRRGYLQRLRSKHATKSVTTFAVLASALVATKGGCASETLQVKTEPEKNLEVGVTAVKEAGVLKARDLKVKSNDPDVVNSTADELDDETYQLLTERAAGKIPEGDSKWSSSLEMEALDRQQKKQHAVPKFLQLAALGSWALSLENIKNASQQMIDLNARDDSDRTALMYATKAPVIQPMEFLLQLPNVNVNCLVKDEGTPLHVAVKENKADMVRLLLRQPDIEPNLFDGQGLAPLHVAARKGNTALVEELLKSPKVDINLHSEHGLTPLTTAIRSMWPDVCELLLNKGADFFLKSKLGAVGARDEHMTPLLEAVKVGKADIVRVLLRHWAKLVYQEQPPTQQELAAAFDAAVRRQHHKDRLQGALQHGAIEIDDACGAATHLPQAGLEGQGGHEQVVSILGASRIKLPADRAQKFDLNEQRTLEGQIALHLAARFCNENVILMLLDAGLSPVALDNNDMTPIDVAIAAGRSPSIITALRVVADKIEADGPSK